MTFPKKETSVSGVSPDTLLPSNAVEFDGDHPFTTSLMVADIFGKLHAHVLRDIDSLHCSPEFLASNFGSTFRKVPGPNNAVRQERYFKLTKNGFTFLVMGYTGPKAAEFKEAYILRFDALEAQAHASGSARLDSPALALPEPATAAPFALSRLLLDGVEQWVVSGRALHAALFQAGHSYVAWIRTRIDGYHFALHGDFEQVFKGARVVDHWLTLDMAKQLAQIENSPEGREVRQWLLAFERTGGTAAHAAGQGAIMVDAQGNPYVAVLPPPDPLNDPKVRSAINRKAHALSLIAFEHNREIIEAWLRRGGDLTDPAAAIERIHALDLDHGKHVLVDMQLLCDVTRVTGTLQRTLEQQQQAIARLSAATGRTFPS